MSGTTKMAREGRAAVLGPLLFLAACVPAASSIGPGPEGPATTRVVVPDSTDPQGHGRADYDWTIRTLEGERVRLDAYRGRVLFVNLWASWCAPCVAEMASIQRLRHSLRGTGIEFLLVSPEEPEPVERFLRRYEYDLPVFLEVGEMPRAFGLRALPTTYVVDRAGNIVLKHRGAAEWDDVAVQAFLRNLAGRP